MMAEQGDTFMASYGGAVNYRATARMSPNDRITYLAIQEGYDNSDDISNVTGLTVPDVNRSLTNLKRQDLIAEVQIGEF